MLNTSQRSRTNLTHGLRGALRTQLAYLLRLRTLLLERRIAVEVLGSEVLRPVDAPDFLDMGEDGLERHFGDTQFLYVRVVVH